MVALLTASNVFMTFAWYGHLKTLEQRAWTVAALASWGIALFELRDHEARAGFGIKKADGSRKLGFPDVMRAMGPR